MKSQPPLPRPDRWPDEVRHRTGRVPGGDAVIHGRLWYRFSRPLQGRDADPRPAPVTDDDPAALTPREREVAALLAEGLTNAEVARRLYISTKTAAVHVSNILAKLGMGSRAEVAAWAVRTGVAADI